MRILITGASGMLGASLMKMLAVEHDVYGTGNSEFQMEAFKYMQFDLMKNNFAELIDWSNPELVIHCGALTNGNFCDENVLKAFDVNGISMKKILDATDRNVKIIYISTDAVFPSELHMAKEEDSVSPENVYGKSKELGEFFLRSSNRKYCIVRTTIVGLNLNSQKKGFVEWIINSVKNDEEINLFKDVLFSPISIWDLSKELMFIINEDYINSEILHIAGNDFCTKYEFGRLLVKELGLEADKINVSSIMTFKNRAKRCKDQSMDCSKYQNKYSRVLPSLKETVDNIKFHFNEQN